MEDISIIIPQNAFLDSDSDLIECYQIIEEGPAVAESDTVEFLQIIEEGPCVAETETAETAQAVEERPKVCPLCSSQTKYFKINLTEKIFLCEAVECGFPFGYEDLQLQIYEGETDNISDITSTTYSGSQLPDSLNTRIVNFDLDKKINADDHVFLQPKSENRKTYSKKKGIKKDLDDLKGFNMQLHEMSKTKSEIKNQKWIRKLKNLQDKSGFKLLQSYELKNVTVEKKNEVKLDIESGDDKTVCSIKILMDSPSPSIIDSGVGP